MAQSLLITIKNGKEPVPYVSIYDTTQGIAVLTNALGQVAIPAIKEYSLIISHVSFKSLVYNSPKMNHDTIITLLVQPKITDIPTVVVSNVKAFKKKQKLLEIGNGFQKSINSYSINSKQKMGIAFEGYKQDSGAQIRSIKFRLKKIESRPEDNFIVELKIYSIENQIISKEPINYLPILINARELRKQNEIVIKEKILMPEEGIFVSLEIPVLSTGNKIVFPMHMDNNNFFLYTMSNNQPNWDIMTLLKRNFRINPITNTTTCISFGVTYYN